MQKFNWWLVSGLLVVGMAIFFLSLYTASLAGLRRQLGLVGGDLRLSVDVPRLYRGIIEVGTVPQCAYWQSIVPVPRYIFAKEGEKLELGKVLAYRRIECAIDYTLSGNIERGVYTLLKAIRYQQAGLLLLEKGIANDKKMCNLYQSNSAFGYIEAYLEASTGSVRGTIEREYAELQRLAGQVVEMCAD